MVWSSGSPRPLAAVMAIFRFSLSLSCPIKSARHRGRRLVSSGASSVLGLPDTTRAIVYLPSGCHSEESSRYAQGKLRDVRIS